MFYYVQKYVEIKLCPRNQFELFHLQTQSITNDHAL